MSQVKMKKCPKCRWPNPKTGYQSVTGQYFGRCPACGFTSLPSTSEAVARVLWNTADAPDQQGKLTMPL